MMQTELKVGLDFAAPIPLHSDFSSKTFEGFEVDLMKIISDKLGLKLVYEVSLWTTILEKLQEGKIDVICTAVTITPERQRILTFSDPYLSCRLCAVTNKEKPITSLDHRSAKNIGVRRATEAGKFVETHLGERKVIFSDTNEELYQLLNDRKIDLLIDDSPIAGAFVKLNHNLIVSFFLKGTESQYGIALKKDNLQGKYLIDKVLSEIKLNGNWKILYDKWFKDIRM